MDARRLRDHWPEYAIEAASLALFLVAAAGFATLIHHPQFFLRQALPHDLPRRVLMGAAMGITAIAIIYSPAGARSGAHLNPATTLTFWRLGRVHGVDAVCYVAAHFAGAVGGILAARLLLAPWIGAPAVRYVSTVPGVYGPAAAFAGETAIAFVLMSVVLHVSNSRHARLTGVCTGLLVWTYIVIEEPLSGMSLNPARSFGPALLAGDLNVFWIYLTAPTLGMLAAAQAYVRVNGVASVRCAKLHHPSSVRCIFHCRFGAHWS